MAGFEIAVEMDIKNMVKEVKEIAQVWGDFARDLEKIEKKYQKQEESEEEQ